MRAGARVRRPEASSLRQSQGTHLPVSSLAPGARNTTHTIDRAPASAMRASSRQRGATSRARPRRRCQPVNLIPLLHDKLDAPRPGHSAWHAFAAREPQALPTGAGGAGGLRREPPRPGSALATSTAMRLAVVTQRLIEPCPRTRHAPDVPAQEKTKRKACPRAGCHHGAGNKTSERQRRRPQQQPTA